MMAAFDDSNTKMETNHEESENSISDCDLDDKKDDDEETWPEKPLTPTLTSCIFCSENFEDKELLLYGHLNQSHGLDVKRLIRKHKMDQIMYIRLINYLRYKVLYSPISSDREEYNDYFAVLIKEIMDCDTTYPWNEDTYMQPIIDDDPLLLFLIEGCDDKIETNQGTGVTNYLLDCLTRQDTNSHKNEIDFYKAEIVKMKNVVQNLLAEKVEKKKKGPFEKTCGSSNQNQTVDDDEDVVAIADEDYFHSYDDIEIHAEMLNDKARTNAYKNAILKNSDSFRNKVVIDLGCGTGILSLFAAQAGASKVFAIDKSEIIYDAMEIIQENGYEKVIKCISSTIEEAGFDFGKVDIIISEFMGYFLLFEGMINSLIFARDRYLAKDGLMFPNKASVFMVGCSDEEYYYKEYEFWDNVYGFKMPCLKKRALLEARNEDVKSETIITTANNVLDLDLMVCQPHHAIIRKSLSLEVTRSANLTALVGYFDVDFSMGNMKHAEKLSTSPACTPTHWKQVIFLLPKKIQVTKGDILTGFFKCYPAGENKRSLEMEIDIEDIRCKYVFK